MSQLMNEIEQCLKLEGAAYRREANGDLIKEWGTTDTGPIWTRFHELPSGELEIVSYTAWTIPPELTLRAQFEIKVTPPLTPVRLSIDSSGVPSCRLVVKAESTEGFCFDLDEFSIDTMVGLEPLRKLVREPSP